MGVTSWLKTKLPCLPHPVVPFSPQQPFASQSINTHSPAAHMAKKPPLSMTPTLHGNVKYNSACLLGRPVSSGNAAKCKRILPRKPQEVSGDVLGTGQQPLLLRSGGVMWCLHVCGRHPQWLQQCGLLTAAQEGKDDWCKPLYLACLLYLSWMCVRVSVLMCVRARVCMTWSCIVQLTVATTHIGYSSVGYACLLKNVMKTCVRQQPFTCWLITIARPWHCADKACYHCLVSQMCWQGTLPLPGQSDVLTKHDTIA